MPSLQRGLLWPPTSHPNLTSLSYFFTFCSFTAIYTHLKFSYLSDYLLVYFLLPINHSMRIQVAWKQDDIWIFKDLDFCSKPELVGDRAHVGIRPSVSRLSLWSKLSIIFFPQNSFESNLKESSLPRGPLLTKSLLCKSIWGLCLWMLLTANGGTVLPGGRSGAVLSLSTAWPVSPLTPPWWWAGKAGGRTF